MFACMYEGTPTTCMPGIQKVVGYLVLWNWSHRWWWANMRVSRSSARAVSALNHRAISNSSLFDNTQTLKSLEQAGELDWWVKLLQAWGATFGTQGWLLVLLGMVPVLARLTCVDLDQNIRSCFFVSKPMARLRLGVGSSIRSFVSDHASIAPSCCPWCWDQI